MDFEKVTIGDATLYRGDSTQLLNAGVLGKFDAIVSDPPYGIGYAHSGGGGSDGIAGANKALNDDYNRAFISHLSQ